MDTGRDSLQQSIHIFTITSGRKKFSPVIVKESIKIKTRTKDRIGRQNEE